MDVESCAHTDRHPDSGTRRQIRTETDGPAPPNARIPQYDYQRGEGGEKKKGGMGWKRYKKEHARTGKRKIEKDLPDKGTKETEMPQPPFGQCQNPEL